LNELALFAGAGGGILGGLLTGWRTVCAVERDAWCASVLARRQDDGILAPFPVWSDVRSFDGTQWRGLVDVVSGGFPCQDISVAGKGAGLDGARSGLWSEFFRIICEVRPRFAFVENSPALTSRGLARVVADIASIGADAQWCFAGADDQGAWHQRKRLWLVADFDGAWEQQPQGLDREIGGWAGNGATDIADSDGSRCEEQRSAFSKGSQHSAVKCGDWWAAEPGVVRMVHGLAHRVDRIAALGNGQVPIVAASAWARLKR
jgi:DNA (cytosine-5)-methyltransferase 1